MNLICSRSTNQIIQTTESTTANATGRYVLELPPGVAVVVDPTSYVLNANVEDAGSVTTLAFQAWLAQYPEFQHVLYNLFLTAADHSDLDFAGSVTIGGTPYRARCQRGYTAPGTAQGAGTVALLDNNPSSHAGFVATLTVDITAAPINGVATDRFLPWWSVATQTVSPDYYATAGILVGDPHPAQQTWTRLAPTAVSVYLSNDNGATWQVVNWMTIKTMPAVGSNVRLAFLNNNATKVWLCGYGLAF